jgi:hypothetical protein
MPRLVERVSLSSAEGMGGHCAVWLPAPARGRGVSTVANELVWSACPLVVDATRAVSSSRASFHNCFRGLVRKPRDSLTKRPLNEVGVSSAFFLVCLKRYFNAQIGGSRSRFHESRRPAEVFAA